MAFEGGGSSLDDPTTADMQEFEARMRRYAERDSQLPPEADIGPFIVFLTFEAKYTSGELAVCPGSLEHQAQLLGSWKRTCAAFSGVLEGLEKRSLPSHLLGTRTAPLVGLPEQDGDQSLALEIGSGRLLRVLISVHQLHDVRYCPLLVNVVQILLHYLPDALCFEVVNHMLSNTRDIFFEIDSFGVASVHYTFKAIFRARMPVTFSLLQRHHVIDEYCRLVLDELFISVLPFRMVMRVLDEFLRFGMHALFRFGLGLITTIKADIKAYMSGDRCESPSAWKQTLVRLARKVDFHELWRDANNGHGKNLRFRHLPVQDILAQTIQKVATSQKLRARLTTSAESMRQRSGDPSAMEGGMPLAPLLFDEQTEQLRLQGAFGTELGQGGPSHSSPVRHGTHALLLSEPQFRVLLATWLPMNLRQRRLKLAFSTITDGYNLATLLARVAALGGADGRSLQDSLLVLRDSTERTFGCFATTRWRRMPSTFGTSSSALFNLSPNPSWFPNLSSEGQMVVTGRALALGLATSGTGFGLMVDEDLNQGSSTPVSAFANPPIHVGVGSGEEPPPFEGVSQQKAAEEEGSAEAPTAGRAGGLGDAQQQRHGQNGDFQITTLEVYVLV